MVTVSLAHAKAHPSELLDQVEKGQAIVITRGGRPVARLTLIEPPKNDAAVVGRIQRRSDPADAR